MYSGKEFPLPINNESQGKLVQSFELSSEQDSLTRAAIAVLNYDNGVLIAPNNYSVKNLVKPIYDWYQQILESELFFRLPRSVLSLRERVIQVKARGWHDLNIWENITDIARETLKQLPEDSNKEHLWMSIYGDYPDLDTKLLKQATSSGLVPDKDQLAELRKRLKIAGEQRIKELGSAEIASLNGFETKAVVQYSELAINHFGNSTLKSFAETHEEADVNRFRSMLNTPWFYNSSTLETTLRAIGNWCEFGRMPQRWDIACAGILMSAISHLDKVELSRQARNSAIPGSKEEAHALERDYVIMNDIKRLNDIRSVFLLSWESYAEIIHGWSDNFHQKPFNYRLLNRYIPIYNQIMSVVGS